MDQTKNRPSRPRLRTPSNSARVLVFDQAESEQGAAAAAAKMEPNTSDVPRRLLSTPKIESKEAPVRPGMFIFIINLKCQKGDIFNCCNFLIKLKICSKHRPLKSGTHAEFSNRKICSVFVYSYGMY